MEQEERIAETVTQKKKKSTLQDYGDKCICCLYLVVLDAERHHFLDPDVLREFVGQTICLNASCLDSPLHEKNEVARIEQRLAAKKMLCGDCKMLVIEITSDLFRTIPTEVVQAHMGKTVCINPACASSPLNTKEE